MLYLMNQETILQYLIQLKRAKLLLVLLRGKFEFTYNGWENIDNLSIEAKFTPKDLTDPVIYNASYYN